MDTASTFPVPDQAGRTVVVTGTNSGLGFEAAKRLTVTTHGLTDGKNAVGTLDPDSEALRDTANATTGQGRNLPPCRPHAITWTRRVLRRTGPDDPFRSGG